MGKVTAARAMRVCWSRRSPAETGLSPWLRRDPQSPWHPNHSSCGSVAFPTSIGLTPQRGIRTTVPTTFLQSVRAPYAHASVAWRIPFSRRHTRSTPLSLNC